VTLTYDLNADLGEGFGIWALTDDAALLDVVTSANVACGFHAGDPSTMRRVCDLAAERAVRVGAQVSYRDLAGFGRREMLYDPEDLTADLIYQIGGLAACAKASGTKVSYVKPHGALYNRVAHDHEQAAAVVRAIEHYDRSLPLLGAPGSVLLGLAARAGIHTVPEVFADRAYTPDGRLVPRRVPGSVLTNPAQVVERAVRLVTEACVETVDGSDLRLSARSLCVHGDTPDASRMAHRIRAALEAAHVRVEAFT
jgi:UPF0271 protein